MKNRYDQCKDNQIQWRCLRGMLELDLFLLPFAKTVYSTLSSEEQHCFQALLTLEDPVLFTWLMGSESPQDPMMVQCVEKIRQFRRQMDKNQL